MTERERQTITPAELRVMKVVWALRSATVRDVLNRLAEKQAEPPAYTTVMTLMNQLAEKGALAVDKERQPFLYTPAVQREQVLRERLRHFLSTVFDGHATELVLGLVEEAQLSPEDLRRLEARIAERERQAQEGRGEGEGSKPADTEGEDPA